MKAFDRISRVKVLAQVKKKIKHKDLVSRIFTRHKCVKVKSTADEAEITMVMHTGVPQGCPLGPPLYVTGYEGVTDDIDEARALAGHSRITAQAPFSLSPHNIPVVVDRTTFVDDHLEHRILSSGNNFDQIYAEIKELVTIIMDTQKTWDIDNNLDKTVVLIDLHGRGSRKALKKMNGVITLDDGRVVRIAQSTKYLGVKIGGHLDSVNEEIGIRIKRANEAMGRLVKFWRSRTLPLSNKITLYNSLVRTLLTYGMEARVLATSQISRLESAQTRHLRRIGESPAHIEHESNELLRARLKSPSIESWLRKLRLGMWNKLASHNQPAVTNSVLGGMNFDSHECNRERTKQLKDDLLECAKIAPLQFGLTLSHDNSVRTDKFMWKSLAGLSKSHIHKTLTYWSMADRRNATRLGPSRELKFICDTCGGKYGTNAGLQTHRTKAHSVVHPLRSLVTSNICPLCNAILADPRGAQLHVQRVCAKKYTTEQIDAVVARLNRQQLPATQRGLQSFLQ